MDSIFTLHLHKKGDFQKEKAIMQALFCRGYDSDFDMHNFEEIKHELQQECQKVYGVDVSLEEIQQVKERYKHKMPNWDDVLHYELMGINFRRAFGLETARNAKRFLGWRC